MKRRKARENAFIAMFAASFGGDALEAMQAIREETQTMGADDFGEVLLQLYQNHAEAIDNAIQANLKGWKVNRLHKVNLALLRLSVAEMLYGGEDIDSVVINEAVELAKKYGDESDYQFVNGLLGSISRAKTAAKDTVGTSNAATIALENTQSCDGNATEDAKA
ncbi:MAG: transcription antitermination factor NusB [Ruminococcaceae bacterium]|nr:transcription antitermination factor NusB [Oscillospiraceae bacterium]